MPTELEVTKREFYSQYNSLDKEDESLFIEDCRFQVFTDLLYEADIIKSPAQVARKKSVFKRSNWGLLGYCLESILLSEGDENEDEDEDSEYEKNLNWQYTVINGFFGEQVEVESATKEEIDKALKGASKFIEATLEESLINDVSETRSLQDEIISANKNNCLDKIEILIITDKLINQDVLERTIIIREDFSVNVYYWDLKKWNDLKRSKSKRLPIAIDLKEEGFENYNIDFVKKATSRNLNQYLAVFPGELIYDLYDYHNTKLLENNVRLFLSANRKANKAIRETIADDANYFFSYNNGISATAEKIIIIDNKISKIEDFQIVNGGQTTASIHYAKKIDGSDLTDVFVPVKITELKRDDKYGETVGNISKAANTQSSIKNSDFYANRPLLIEIERLSLKNPASDQYGINKYYFFERMSGQYNAAKNSVSTRKKLIAAWSREHPKEISFTKIEIARWYNCIQEYPHIAASGAENQFTSFLDEKNYELPKMNFGNFKNIIGFGMIFNRIRKLVGSKTGREYPSIIGDSSVGMSSAIYAATYLHKVTEGRIDYWSIYELNFGLVDSLMERKRIDLKIDKVLVELILESWEQLKKYGGTSVQEQTKKEPCWEYFKRNFRNNKEILQLISPFLISKEELDIRKKSDLANNDDERYFIGLTTLLKDNGSALKNILEISSTQTSYRANWQKINNLIKKIESNKNLISKNKVENSIKFYNELNRKGINLIKSNALEIPDLKFNLVFEKFFKDFEKFKNDATNLVLDPEKEESFNENSAVLEKIIELKDKYEREYGLALEDLVYLNSHVNTFD